MICCLFLLIQISFMWYRLFWSISYWISSKIW